MVLEPYKKVFSDAWRWWGEDQVPRLAAALTFYAMLSLAPMLLLAVTTAGFVLGEESAKTGIIEQIKSSLGAAQATFVETLLRNQSPGTGVLAAVFGIVILMFGASGLFEQLRDSVNAIWGQTSPQGGFLTAVKRKVFGILGVVAGAIVILGWMILDARLQWLSKNTFDTPFPLWQMLSLVLSWLFASLVFATMFKYMPRKRIEWGDVRFAAIFTALAFTAGKFLLSLYFAFASVSAGYGAAGALVVILLWIYYSSQILFYGVELSNAYAYDLGSLKGQPHDSEAKVTPTGQVSECAEGEISPKTEGPAPSPVVTKPSAPQTAPPEENLHDSHVPAPSLTASLSGLGQSLGYLGKSFSDLGQSFKGKKRQP